MQHGCKKTTGRLEDNRFIVLAESSFAQDWLDNRLRDTIERAVTLAADPMAPLVFQSLAEEAGGAALVESWQFWKNLGYPPPWKDLVKGFLKGKNG